MIVGVREKLKIIQGFKLTLMEVIEMLEKELLDEIDSMISVVAQSYQCYLEHLLQKLKMIYYKN